MTRNGQQRPQDLVFTLYGEYLLGRDEPAWVGSLIRLLEPFGLSEGAVRTVLSRMSRKGWLDARRVGRRAYYSLSDRGRTLLEEGQERIFHASWDRPWDGTWLVVAYSIPETTRRLRDRLRVQLAWLGFGSLGNGLWISPHDVEVRVREIAARMRIAEHLEAFRARRVSDTPVADLVRKCWDLDAIHRSYADFIARWRPELERCRKGVPSGRVTPEACYVLRFRLIHEFRRFPLEDPYLPRELLPPDWSGDEADALFHELHDLLEGPADAWVEEALADERY